MRRPGPVESAAWEVLGLIVFCSVCFVVAVMPAVCHFVAGRR